MKYFKISLGCLNFVLVDRKSFSTFHSYEGGDSLFRMFQNIECLPIPCPPVPDLWRCPLNCFDIVGKNI